MDKGTLGVLKPVPSSRCAEGSLGLRDEADDKELDESVISRTPLIVGLGSEFGLAALRRLDRKTLTAKEGALPSPGAEAQDTFPKAPLPVQIPKFMLLIRHSYLDAIQIAKSSAPESLDVS